MIDKIKPVSHIGDIYPMTMDDLLFRKPFDLNLDRFLAVSQRFKLEGLLRRDKYKQEEEEEETHIPKFETPTTKPEKLKLVVDNNAIQLNKWSQNI